MKLAMRLFGCRRAIALVLSFAFAALLLPATGSRAAARVATKEAAARLDPTFGQDGRTTLPLLIEGNLDPVLTHDDGLVVSAGGSLRRLTAAGEMDESFGDGGTVKPTAPADGSFEIAGIAVDSRDRLVVAGTSTLAKEAGQTFPPFGNSAEVAPQAVRVLRYRPDGSLDSSFGDRGVVETGFGLPPAHNEAGEPLLAQPWVEATGVAVDTEDRVIISGGASVGVQFGCAHDWFFDTLTYAAFVGRLTEAGAVDAGFGGGDGVFGGHSTAENPLQAEFSVAPMVAPSGQVTYAAGVGRCPRAEGSSGLARLAADGTPQSSFGVGGAIRSWFTAATTGSDGSILALGYAGPWYFTKEPARVRVTRFGSNGEPTQAYGRDGQAVLRTPGGAGGLLDAIAVDRNGRALLAGTMISARAFPGPTDRAKDRHRRWFVLVRIGPNGRPDRAFGPRGRVAAGFGSLMVGESDLLLDSKGRAVIVGTYRRGDNGGLAVARYVISR